MHLRTSSTYLLVVVLVLLSLFSFSFFLFFFSPGGYVQEGPAGGHDAVSDFSVMGHGCVEGRYAYSKK
jgi:hypothetical protein